MNDILYSAAAERNQAPILEVLQRVLPPAGTVLEIASGTGQHVVHFATALPAHHWQPSDPDPAQRASIAARTAESGLTNIAPPLALDVLETWPDVDASVVIVANLLHISPAATLPALCAGAAAVLPAGGVLHIYGPFKRGDQHTSKSNVSFDADLRHRNPAWGIRDMELVQETADDHGFASTEVNAMPANNFSLVFTRLAHTPDQ